MEKLLIVFKKQFSLLQEVLQTFRINKFRRFLSILGIFIATTALVSLLSCGNFATHKALSALQSLGSDLMSVSMHLRLNHQPLKSTSIDLSITKELFKHTSNMIAMTPYARSFLMTSYRGHVLDSQVLGIGGEFKKTTRIDLSQGRAIGYWDKNSYFCMIGAHLANRIQAWNPLQPILGKQIAIHGTFLTIIGVLEPTKNHSFFIDDFDETIIMPFDILQRFDPTINIQSLLIRFKQGSSINELKSLLSSHLKSKLPNLFIQFKTPQQLISQIKKQRHALLIFLGFMGFVVLIVGGIGVMNVMLVSITERKQEIGLRLALGASNSDIHAFFLMESFCLTFIGGILGLLSGLSISWAVAYFAGWRFFIVWKAIGTAILASGCSGIFFGYYPAKQATKLKPITLLKNNY